MGQRCVHYTERDNGTRVLYAPNQCHINPTQKKFKNMYLIIDNSGVNSVFSIQLQNE